MGKVRISLISNKRGSLNAVSTVLRDATGIVTTYMVDVVVVWVWLTILLHILPNFTQSQHNFTTVTVTGHQISQEAFGQSQIMSLQLLD